MSASSEIELVLVDFDDTLVDTAPRFQNARRGLFSLLRSIGIAEETANRLHHDLVDPRMLKQFGLGPHRMEHSFRETYEVACREHDLEVIAELAEQCAALGRVVAGTPPLLPGAIPALEKLKRHYRTVLYTQAGNADYQLGCIRDSGVFDILGVEAIRICERKTTGAFRATITELGVTDVSRVIMIGNSIRSDLNPALEAGARGILVDVADPWEFDLVDPFSDDFIALPSFAAAVEYLIGTDLNDVG